MNYLIFSLSFIVFTAVFYFIWQLYQYYSAPKLAIFVEEKVYQLFNKEHIEYFISALKHSIETDLEQVKEHYKEDRKSYDFHKKHNHWGKVVEVRLEAEIINENPTLCVWVDTIKLESYAGYCMLLLDNSFDIAFWVHSSQKGLLQPFSINTYHSDDYDSKGLEALYNQYLGNALDEYLELSVSDVLDGYSILYDNSPTLERIILLREATSNEIHINLTKQSMVEIRSLSPVLVSGKYRTEISKEIFFELMDKKKIEVFTNDFNTLLYK